ncbi:hypothetical protein [Metaclostridioides mangenotii]|uniref:ATP synthase F0 subunit 8 n=1 Tax=Metaclostridioides mangenotii TaxID=1540 RepID=A0ABS4EDX4_9FIRM|nr:hypothetical protein [Clostridioides mangenotii]MBP1856140.1 hypothetical protein [Clostridioides mangenotii]
MFQIVNLLCFLCISFLVLDVLVFICKDAINVFDSSINVKKKSKVLVRSDQSAANYYMEKIAK